jgi:hypothetical protein
MPQVLRCTKVMVLIALGVVAMAACGAAGQQTSQPQDPQQRIQNFMSMWNPQAMIDQSVRQAAKRYSLTPEQEQVARKMTTDGVNAFLDKHEMELRGLLRDAIQARFSGSTPSTQQVQDWAKQAAPLLGEIKKAVLDGNRQFRDVLTDDQKKVFDIDQKVIQQQFDHSNTVVNRWIEGKFSPETDLPRGAWFNDAPRRQPASTRPSPAGQGELDRWDLYVRGFINRYDLDAAQTSQAMGILVDSKRRATEYWFSRKADIDAANERIKDVLADASRGDQVPGARKQLDDLNKPVETLYVEMQERLNKIPTDTQRKAFEVETQARRERWRDRIRRTGGETAVSATSQSQPSASQIAEADPAAPLPATGSGPATRPVRTVRPTASRLGPSSLPSSQPQPVLRGP